MIDVAEALARLADATAEPLAIERVPLDAAVGRVIAETVRADRDFPPTDRSAMDGFAVRSGDAAEPGARLQVTGEARAGGAAAPPVGAGEAVRIFTGGVVPEGADAVVMVEDTAEDRGAGTVAIRVAVRPGQHVRPRASDQARGDTVLEPGAPIQAAEVAALVSVGHLEVAVHRAPRVAVLATGDEIVEPDRHPAPHQVRNSNARALLAQVAELGCAGRYLGIAPDERGGLDALLREGFDADVLLVTGGVSVGEYDLVGQALADAGMQLLFHKVAVKPGKPILAGRAGDTLVIGLPGNPVSAFVGFQVFVAPALRRLAGQRAWANAGVDARLEEPIRKRPGRLTYHLARVAIRDGAYRATPVTSTGSGDVLALCKANALVVTPADAGLTEAGATVSVLLWRDAAFR